MYEHNILLLQYIVFDSHKVGLGSEDFITDLKKAKTELAKLTVKSLSEAGRKEIANIAREVGNANSTGLHSARLSKSVKRFHSESPRTLTDSERSDKRNELEKSGFYDGFGKGKSGLLLQPENGEVGHAPKDNGGLPTRVERKENFWKWFGGSLTTIDGKPMVFWQKSKTFGQNGEESWKFKDEFLGSNLPHPRTQFGPTFTSLKAQAEHYSGTNRGYYLRIENPLVIPYSKTENRFKNQDDAIAFANRMENLEGYDSIIIPEMQFIFAGIFGPN